MPRAKRVSRLVIRRPKQSMESGVGFFFFAQKTLSTLRPIDPATMMLRSCSTHTWPQITKSSLYFVHQKYPRVCQQAMNTISMTVADDSPSQITGRKIPAKQRCNLRIHTEFPQIPLAFPSCVQSQFPLSFSQFASRPKTVSSTTGYQ